MEFKVGRPPGLTPEVEAKIIDAIPRVYVVGLIADYVGVPRNTLYDWLKWGREDQKDSKDSIYAQLSGKYRSTLAKSAEEKLTTLSSCPRNYQAITWMLEKCFKKDFGKDSEEYQKLVDLVFNQLLPLMSKGVDNAREKIEKMDPECD